MSEWQPIETAPKDGTPLWAVCMEAQSPAARVSWFQCGWQVVSAAEKFCPAGPHKWWPTHWQPFPAAPVIEARRAEAEGLGSREHGDPKGQAPIQNPPPQKGRVGVMPLSNNGNSPLPITGRENT